MFGQRCLLIMFHLTFVTLSAEVLVAGMKYGSLIRYEGDRTESVSKQNHPDARKHPHELLQLVLQELQLGRVIGPFSLQSPPFECVKICPLNIVPNGEKKWRLIKDLSSPQKHSVNGWYSSNANTVAAY